MAIIYRLRYWSNGEPVEQNFKYEQDARFNYDRLLENPAVKDIDLYRQKIMRPSVRTILRILNGESHVLEQKKIATTGDNHKGGSA